VADSEWLNLIIAGGVAAAAIIIALIFIYTTRNKKNSKKPPEKTVTGIVDARESWLSRALKTEHTITTDDAKKAKDELKIMDLEREVLSYAIRRLYEAQAEGKITEEERERLAKWYKSRMMEVRDTINRNESVVALHELETMQEDLVKLFSNRFDELTKKVEEMRDSLHLKTEEEAQVETALTPTLELEEEAESDKEKEKKKARKKPAPTAEPSGKTGAEKRIEEIKSEVEKVLERLGQIETEG
jgi:hypothetical protein